MFFEWIKTGMDASIDQVIWVGNRGVLFVFGAKDWSNNEMEGTRQHLIIQACSEAKTNPHGKVILPISAWIQCRHSRYTEEIVCKSSRPGAPRMTQGGGRYWQGAEVLHLWKLTVPWSHIDEAWGHLLYSSKTFQHLNQCLTPRITTSLYLHPYSEFFLSSLSLITYILNNSSYNSYCARY